MHASLLTLLTCGCQGSCANLEFKASPVLEFQKTEKSLNFFSENEWKALKSLEFVYRESFHKTGDMMTVQTSCHSCYKAGRRTA